MPESARTRFLRWYFNVHPAYRGTGGRVTYIEADFSEIRIKLPLNRRTRNYVGTIFGGSLYACTDPMYMVMLIRILGSDYIVWDKAATIRFRKPGRSTLYATFRVEPDEVAAIREATAGGEPIDRVYRTELKDAEGIVHAEIEKVIYIRRKPQ